MTVVQNRVRSRGRHPLLKLGSLYNQIYQEFLLADDGLTSTEVRDRLGLEHTVAMARVTELKNQGLIAPTGERRLSSSGRPSAVLRAVRHNETGFGRDEVKVETRILVNKYGEYSATSRVIGQNPGAMDDEPKVVHVYTRAIHVPRPDEPYLTREIFDENFGPHVGGSTTLTNDQEIIDIIPEDVITE